MLSKTLPNKQIVTAEYSHDPEGITDGIKLGIYDRKCHGSDIFATIMQSEDGTTMLLINEDAIKFNGITVVHATGHEISAGIAF